MENVRKIIEIDEDLCTGCGECVPDCAEGSLEIIDGKAKLVADKLCDGLGACLKSCPTGALTIIERPADAFDEEAVEKFLAEKKKKETAPIGGGCPSAQIQMHGESSPCQSANQPIMQRDNALTHWPIQIRLIPASAPFLENADILVAADCAAAAYANFHQEFLQGKVVMMGCPKFDDAEMYVDRFAEILEKRTIKSLTILIMEVPCCSSMLAIIKQARDRARSSVEVHQVVVSVQGNIINEQTW